MDKTHTRHLLRYIMLIKNIMDEMAYLNSCLATKGHRTQLTTMGAVTPTKNAIPFSTARSNGEVPPPLACRPREMTVNDKHPTKPDRYQTVSSCLCAATWKCEILDVSFA